MPHVLARVSSDLTAVKNDEENSGISSDKSFEDAPEDALEKLDVRREDKPLGHVTGI